MKASMTQEEPRVAPHRASWRAAQDELPSVASELARLRAEKEVDRALIAAQDARLAKAGADLEECKKLASGLITDIGAEKEARAVAERIARERAAEVQRLEAVLASECAVTDAYDAGLEAALDGKSLHDCPFGDFGPDSRKSAAWEAGWWQISRKSALEDTDARACHLAEEVEHLRARVQELEPLAAVGRRVSLLRPGNRLCHASKGGAWYVHVIGGEPEADESTPLGALRAAGIGEERP